MSSKPQNETFHESSAEATARRKRTLTELRQLSKCYRHNSDLLHATFALRALRRKMKQQSRGCEDSLEVNVTRDDEDEVHCKKRTDGIFRALSGGGDDESSIDANVALPGQHGMKE